MTRFFPAVVFAALLAVSTASSAPFKLPADKPVVSIAIPASWKPVEIEKGVQAQTPDDAVYLAAETTKSEKGMNAIIDETFNMLKEHKFSLKGGRKKENKFDLNGLAADELIYEGRDEDGPTIVSITFVTIGKEFVLVLTYWASPDGEKKHDAEIKEIVHSIKAIK